MKKITIELMPDEVKPEVAKPEMVEEMPPVEKKKKKIKSIDDLKEYAKKRLKK